MSSFRLKSGDTEFNTRVDALFSSLQSAATELEPQVKREHEEEEEEEDDGEGGRKRRCFTVPRGRPPQWRGRGGRGGRGGGGGGWSGPRNSTPDYIKNPEKWTRYTMRDTKVLSDAENKQEGLKLLSDLSSQDKTKIEDEQTMDTEEDNEPKIIFKKPAVPTLTKAKDLKPVEKEEEEEEEDIDEEEEDIDEDKEEEEGKQAHNSVFGGSRKFHKPEYVVGKSRPKAKGKVVGQVTKSSKEEEEDEEEEKKKKKEEVKLSYLMFEEED